MTLDATAVFVAFITVLGGGGLIGWAAWRKAGSEADKYGAEAASTIVGGAVVILAVIIANGIATIGPMKPECAAFSTNPATLCAPIATPMVSSSQTSEPLGADR